MGDYWGFDIYSETMQYTENVAASSEVVKFPTTGAASFSQTPYNASLFCPYDEGKRGEGITLKVHNTRN